MTKKKSEYVEVNAKLKDIIIYEPVEVSVNISPITVLVPEEVSIDIKPIKVKKDGCIRD
jgi:hypothetical protein